MNLRLQELKNIYTVEYEKYVNKNNIIMEEVVKNIYIILKYNLSKGPFDILHLIVDLLDIEIKNLIVTKLIDEGFNASIDDSTRVILISGWSGKDYKILKVDYSSWNSNKR